MQRTMTAVLGLTLLLWTSQAEAGFIIGPGQVPVGAGDEAFNLIAVDLNNPAALGAGSYVASQFNYQFTDFSGFQTTGTITPVLLTGGGTVFTPVAVGDTITFNGATGFLSVPFGGADRFSLAAGTTVYAGVYWAATQRRPRIADAGRLRRRREHIRRLWRGLWPRCQPAGGRHSPQRFRRGLLLADIRLQRSAGTGYVGSGSGLSQPVPKKGT
jgi:hypothetical protein